MSGSLNTPDTLAALGQVIADLDRRLRSLEANDAAGRGMGIMDRSVFTTASTTPVATGVTTSITPGPSGAMLVLLGADIYPATGPASQVGALTFSYTPLGGAAVASADSLILGGVTGRLEATRGTYIDGLVPGVPVTVNLQAYVSAANDTTGNPGSKNFLNQALIVIPL